MKARNNQRYEDKNLVYDALNQLAYDEAMTCKHGHYVIDCEEGCMDIVDCG